MYRRFLAAGMLAAVLLVSGCSNHATQNTEKTTQAVTESATGESTQTEQTEPASGVKETDIETKQSDGKNKQSEETQDKTSKESEQTAGEQTGDEELHTVIGTLEELGMDQVMLLSDNGNELIFSVEGVKIDLPSGIRCCSNLENATKELTVLADTLTIKASAAMKVASEIKEPDKM